MKRITRTKKIAILFSILVFVGPLVFSQMIIPNWISNYEKGAPIGVEIDVYTETPMGELTLREETDDGSEIVARGELSLEKKYSFTPENLPEGWKFHLEKTPKYLEVEGFRKFVDNTIGVFGEPTDFFKNLQILTGVISGILSSGQSMLTIFRDDKKPGFWFYEYTYIVIIQIKNEVNVKIIN